MEKLVKYFLIVLLVPALFLSGCKDEGEEVTPSDEFGILSSYLVAEGMDLDHVLKSSAGNKFVFAPAEAADVAGKYIIDIRDETTFNAGHIAGAVNVPFTGILDEAAKAGDKQILVVCFTGQTACYATALLRLYGYTEAQALKWGMSGWNAETDSWTAKCGSPANGDESWDTEAAVANTPQSTPSLSTGATTGDAILKARVEATIAAEFQTIPGTAVLEDPSAYYVNNYFSDGHFSGFGHVAGAYRINPILLADETIMTLDPAQTVVTYCYTGQTSAVISAYLNVLGYTAKSLVFGMNGLNHTSDFWTSGEVANHWGFNANPKDFPLVQ